MHASATIDSTGDVDMADVFDSATAQSPASRARDLTSRRSNKGKGKGDVRQSGNRADRSLAKPTAASTSQAGKSAIAPVAKRFVGKIMISTSENSPRDSSDDEAEADLCFICASTVIYYSVAPCNHRTCHICALRLRALYKTKACAHCRSEAQSVIFTNDATTRFEEFTPAMITETDEILSIKYTQRTIFDDTRLLLRFNCPDASCDATCHSWPDLHRHVKATHHKVMCILCTRNKKVFTHQHELFSQQDLKRHEKFGDDHPGTVDQSGFKGHPECGFCRQRFYGDDELYTHCREKHERCFICDRRSQGAERQYYKDYNALEEHFRAHHFLCAEQSCLEKKFVVFESEMDIKSHHLQDHPSGLSKDAKRDARRVDMSTFDYRTPHQQESRRGAASRANGNTSGHGRGRDPNAEPLPVSSAVHLRRDELAYQRQMAIQTSQSAVARTFGGHLSDLPANTSTAASTNTNVRTHTPQAAQAQARAIAPHITPAAMEPTPSLAVAAPERVITAQEHARQIHHSAVTARAEKLLKHDAVKFKVFRESITSYRFSKITAAQLLDTFFSIFDASSTDLGKLVRELAEIYEIPEKRNALLAAWNDWRAINEDYPSLTGSASSVKPADVVAGSGAHRVLKLKSSTAQSSRSAVSNQGSWGNVAHAMTMPNASGSTDQARTQTRETRPKASVMPAISTTGSIAKVGSTTPWAEAPAAPTLARGVKAATTTSKAASTSTSGPAVEAFPALPAAVKPNTSIAGLFTRGTGKWGDANQAAANKTWGAAAESDDFQLAVARSLETGDPSAEKGGKKKKQQGKKQTLYKFG